MNTQAVETILANETTSCLDKMLAILPFIDPDSSRFIEWIWISRMKAGFSETGFGYYDMPYTVDRKMDDMLAMLREHVEYTYTGATLIRGIQFDKTGKHIELYVVLEFSGNFALSVFGVKETVDKIIAEFEARYTEPKTVKLEVLTGFGMGGPKVSTYELKEENQTFAHDDFYPNIPEGIDQFVEDYKNNKSNIILLIGPPGTGKSTFLRTLLFKLERSNNALVSNEPALIHPDLMDWVEGFSEDAVIGIEDADNLVRKRSDGNHQMSALLSHADGVVSNDTKMIISTNLASTKDVDPALIRPGRTYRIVIFGELTSEQANKARAAIKLPPVEYTSSKITLSEALNYDNVVSLSDHKAPQLGFVQTS